MDTLSSSSDSYDISLKDYLLILTSVTLSASCFACYMKYMVSNNPGPTRVIEPSLSSDFQQQL